jgi:hypothetical protein
MSRTPPVVSPGLENKAKNLPHPIANMRLSSAVKLASQPEILTGLTNEYRSFVTIHAHDHALAPKFYRAPPWSRHNCPEMVLRPLMGPRRAAGCAYGMTNGAICTLF